MILSKLLNHSEPWVWFGFGTTILKVYVVRNLVPEKKVKTKENIGSRRYGRYYHQNLSNHGSTW